MNKLDVLSAMQKTHDIIKEHPFRLNFDTQFIFDYKRMLYQLSVNWCDYIYRVEHTPEDESRLRLFGEWVHNYRQELRTYYKDTFSMEFFDYYEQMLQVTHTFLDTGRTDVYYNIDCLFPNDSKVLQTERYEYITEEMCGIDSPILPRYFGTQTSVITDDAAMLEYINTSWYMKNKSAEERNEMFEKWKKETKPVLEWINSQHTETEIKQPAWRSFIISKQ